MKIVETDGIVLKTIDFKEKDSILTFLTRDVGKKAGVLHGGKSMRSGNAAKAELFVLNHFEFSEKMNNDLVRIRKCELLDSYPLIRRNYSNFLHANYFSELLLKCEIPEIDSRDYFEIFKKTISKLSKSNNGIEIKFNFEIKTATLNGNSSEQIPYLEFKEYSIALQYNVLTDYEASIKSFDRETLLIHSWEMLLLFRFA